MAVRDVEVLSSDRLKKITSAVAAALVALPGVMLAQAQRLSNDWLQLKPSDPRSGIPRDNRVAVEQAGDGSTTVAIERRTEPRDAAGMSAFEASRRDEHLHVVVSLEDRKLWVVVGEDTVLE